MKGIEIENKTRRVDWDNQDTGSPVLHFDLTMADMRELVEKAIEEKDEMVALRYMEYLHAYIRGLTDGNRFFRQAPKLNSIENIKFKDMN